MQCCIHNLPTLQKNKVKCNLDLSFHNFIQFDQYSNSLLNSCLDTLILYTLQSFTPCLLSPSCSLHTLLHFNRIFPLALDNCHTYLVIPQQSTIYRIWYCIAYGAEGMRRDNCTLCCYIYNSWCYFSCII